MNGSRDVGHGSYKRSERWSWKKDWIGSVKRDWKTATTLDDSFGSGSIHKLVYIPWIMSTSCQEIRI